MAQTTLVSPDIDIGYKVLELLDAADISPVVALLAVFPEYGDWRLVLSSPDLDQTSMFKALHKVSVAVHGHFPYRLPIKMVLPVKDPFVKELRKRFGKLKETDVDGIRLAGQFIGDRFVDEGYLYRVH